MFLPHARSCVFWPGLNSQITDMCQSVVSVLNMHTNTLGSHSNPIQYLLYPGSLSLKTCLNSMVAYLVTVDHYSDFYEIDKLPTIQSSTVIQATKRHFSRHGIPHTLITDNCVQFTSDLFKTFAKKYQFNHITSSPYWSQSNGRAEAAVKSAKHILLTAEDVDLALRSVRNTPPAGHTFSLAQRLFGRALRSNLPQLASVLEPLTPHRDTVVADHVHRKLQQKRAYDKRASETLPALPPGNYVYAKPLPSSSTKAWIPGQVVGSAGPRSYLIDAGKSHIRQNRVQVQLAPRPHSSGSLSLSQAEPTLPDNLRPNPLTAKAPSPQTPPRSTASTSSTSFSVPASPVSPIADGTSASMFPSSPGSVTPPIHRHQHPQSAHRPLCLNLKQ